MVLMHVDGTGFIPWTLCDRLVGKITGLELNYLFDFVSVICAQKTGNHTLHIKFA